MDQSVVINPSEDLSGDSFPTLHAESGLVAVVLSSEREDSGVDAVSKKSRHACKSYVCQFCSRLCRNAQALGGHMNVHRAERVLAKQLLDLRNQGEKNSDCDVQLKAETRTTTAATATGVAAVAVATAALGRNPQEVTGGGGLSSSSSSKPTSQTLAVASAPMSKPIPQPFASAFTPMKLPPGKSLQEVPSKSRKRRHILDLELRLGFNP